MSSRVKGRPGITGAGIFIGFRPAVQAAPSYMGNANLKQSPEVLCFAWRKISTFVREDETIPMLSSAISAAKE